MTMPLDYPSILKERIAAGEITKSTAINWLMKHGVSMEKAIALLA
jgi:hypothetical protein